MADFYPITYNPNTNQLQEIQSGEGIDLTNNNIKSVGNINSTGIITATTFSGDVTGNADTATALETARTFQITGDVLTSAISFDGTGNVSLAATIQPNSVALGDDTTGNYVATISGTAGEVEVSGSGSETAAVTIGLPNIITVGGVNASGVITATTFSGSGASLNNIPNGALDNSSVSLGGVSVSLGSADSTPAFNLSDATGLPVSSGISGLGANVATFLATPSSANLASAVTGETGSGALVFATSPTLTTPTADTYQTSDIGSQTSGILTTTATTADQVLDTLPTATFQTARYQVSIACTGQLVTAGMTTVYTSVGAITAGSAYTGTTYTNVALTGGSGNDARANIGLSTSGTVTSVTVVSPGSGYEVGDSLSATLGTVGSGFAFSVSNVVRNYQSTDVMILQSVGSAATTCDFIEYSSLANHEILGNFNSDISGSNARLLFTPTYRNNTIKVVRTAVTV